MSGDDDVPVGFSRSGYYSVGSVAAHTGAGRLGHLLLKAIRSSCPIRVVGNLLLVAKYVLEVDSASHLSVPATLVQRIDTHLSHNNTPASLPILRDFVHLLENHPRRSVSVKVASLSALEAMTARKEIAAFGHATAPLLPGQGETKLVGNFASTRNL